ncbi:MAG: glycosyltransferase family 9 protein [Endomicrobium sp.]|jgi:ADP-heptose:LPS heptosyltransferase|nr:glycosyltransferase family 9 protein [Endomicrobium sp.]
MQNKKILIIPRAHIGDFIWVTSAVALIKKQEPSVAITVIIPKNLIEFVKNNPIFNNCYVYDNALFESSNIYIKIFYRFFLFFKSIFILRKNTFDVCFLFSPFELFIKLSLFLKIKKLVYSIYECCGYNVVSREKQILTKFAKQSILSPVETHKEADFIHYSERFQILVRAYFGTSNISLPVIPNLKSSYVKSPSKTPKKIAVCMQGIKTAKNKWPAQYFAETIKKISETFDVEFFIVGGKEQADYADEFILTLHGIKIINMCGKTSLLELKDFFTKIDLLISVDTGLSHIAALTKLKMITFFGMTAPNASIPMSPNNISFYTGIECSPCMYALAFEKKKCPYGDNPKCMEMIKPQEVIQAAIKILEQK